jgi:heat shock protein HtpX
VVNAFSIFFSRVIANIIRQLVDERISHLVFFVATIVFDIVFSMLGMIVVAWFSRAREFRADAGGAALAGRGNMIAALQRLQQNQALVDNSQPQLATMKIAGGKGFMSLISTHPPLEDRIAALQRG